MHLINFHMNTDCGIIWNVFTFGFHVTKAVHCFWELPFFSCRDNLTRTPTLCLRTCSTCLLPTTFNAWVPALLTDTKESLHRSHNIQMDLCSDTYNLTLLKCKLHGLMISKYFKTKANTCIWSCISNLDIGAHTY